MCAGKSRPEIQREIKAKNAAQETLARKYQSRNLSPDDIKHCLYSINDNNSFLTQNRDPGGGVHTSPTWGDGTGRWCHAVVRCGVVCFGEVVVFSFLVVVVVSCRRRWVRYRT